MKDDVLAAEAGARTLGLGKERMGRKHSGLKTSSVLSRLCLPTPVFL